jgi:hypothetical protein
LLPRELRFEMIALERDIEHAPEIEPVVADAVAKPARVECDFLKNYRQERCTLAKQ